MGILKGKKHKYYNRKFSILLIYMYPFKKKYYSLIQYIPTTDSPPSTPLSLKSILSDIYINTCNSKNFKKSDRCKIMDNWKKISER